jgi:carboxylesterase
LFAFLRCAMTPAKQEFSDKIIAGAEPFFFPAGKTGCLLIHGISGTPQVMRLMGEYLSVAGITVLGVRLKGHATRVEDMHLCTYQDWVTSAEEALNQLKEHCSTVFCAGLSMGGVISLRLAALHPTDIAGVITICSPYELRAFKFKFVPLLKRIIKKLATGPRSTNDPLAVEINYAYHSIPAVHELIKLTAAVRGDLPSIRQPVLIFGARQDNTVDSRDISLYYEKLASSVKELVWLENSQHVATIDYDKEIIFQKTVEFINTHK